MKTRTSIFIIGLFCAAVTGMATAADKAASKAPPDRSDESADSDKAKEICRQCGVIEAVVPRIISSGLNGFFAYTLVIRMEETGLRRNIAVGTVGPMNVGDRVRVMGGTVQPLM